MHMKHELSLKQQSQNYFLEEVYFFKDITKAFLYILDISWFEKIIKFNTIQYHQN